MSYRATISLDFTSSDNAEWGSGGNYTVRNLDYVQLVALQRELVEAMSAVLLGYGEEKIAKNAPGKEPTPVVTATNYVR